MTKSETNHIQLQVFISPETHERLVYLAKLLNMNRGDLYTLILTAYAYSHSPKDKQR